MNFGYEPPCRSEMFPCMRSQGPEKNQWIAIRYEKGETRLISGNVFRHLLLLGRWNVGWVADQQVDRPGKFLRKHI